MSPELESQIATRAATSGISPATARLLITGSMAPAAEAAEISQAAVAERADRTSISTSAAELLLRVEASGVRL